MCSVTKKRCSEQLPYLSKDYITEEKWNILETSSYLSCIFRSITFYNAMLNYLQLAYHSHFTV